MAATRFDVLGLREFRLVFAAALVSLFGDGVLPVALAFAVLDLTSSATALGVVLAARTAALVASLPLGGVLADRIGQRALMIGADLVRLIAQGAIAGLLIAERATIVEIAASQALLGAATGLFNPASNGLIPAVAGDQLQQANALRGMAAAIGSIAGPAAGGVLVLTLGAGGAVLADAVSYGISALLLARVRAGAPRRPERPSHFLSELRDGFSEIRSRTWAWSIIVVASFTNAIGVAFWVLGADVARSSLGGPRAWAAILAVRAIGLLAGGAVLLRRSPRRPLLAAVLASAAAALPMVAIAVPAQLIVILLAAMIAGAGSAIFNTLWETTLQEHVPARVRSRVSSYDWLGSLALQPLGYALIGPLAGVIGTSAALYLCGILELAATGLLLAVRDVRSTHPRFPPGSPPSGKPGPVRGIGHDEISSPAIAGSSARRPP
jgi:MFS family permease